MNKQRRGKIQKEINKLELMLSILSDDDINGNRKKTVVKDVNSNIENIMDEEQDAFDNMPEGLQCSMRGEIAEECIDLLSEAIDALDELVEMICDEESDVEDIKDKISEVTDILEDVIYA